MEQLPSAPSTGGDSLVMNRTADGCYGGAGRAKRLAGRGIDLKAMTTIRTDALRVRPGRKIRMSEWPTDISPLYRSKEHGDELLNERRERLEALQDRLYVAHRHSLLIVLQGMDASGKDSVIKHVMSGVNPQGCQVHSFKVPAGEELEHDFLWRCVLRLPGRGRIGIFNRSYYEETLVVRVHPELLPAQGLPKTEASRKAFWQERFQSIVDFERHLHRSQTRIFKFFLHVSKDEQRKRLKARVEDPQKHWKASLQDVLERSRWAEYQRAYADCLSATSTAHAPWHVIPADDKHNARLLVSQVVVEGLEKLRPTYPMVTPERRQELGKIRRLLKHER
jgi:PPK2 family polyphosphate:nucleotide phosphotransferase